MASLATRGGPRRLRDAPRGGRIGLVGLRVAPVVVPVALFLPVLLRGRLLGVRDVTNYYLPLYTLVERAWASGHIPGWNPFSFSGSPLLASGPAAAFYPLNWLYMVVPHLVLYDLLVIAHFAIAGLGAAALARRLTRDEVAAAVAGVGFGLCSYLFGHVVHTGTIAAVAWVPWTFVGLERLRERVTPGNLALAGGALALVAAPGEFQVFSTTVMAIAVYAVVVTVLEWRRGPRLRPVLAAAALGAVAIGLAAIQLAPTASIISYTPRSSYSFDTALSYSFGWLHAPLLLFPYLYGNSSAQAPFTALYPSSPEHGSLIELNGYPGLALLVLAVAGLGAARFDRRVYGLVAMAGVTLLAALGDVTPFARLLYSLPVYGQVRAWGRYTVIFDLVVAVVAAYGVARLRDPRREVRRSAAIAGVAAGGAIVAAALVLPRLGEVSKLVAPGLPGTLAVLVPTLAAVGAAIGCLLALRAPKLAMGVLLALVAVDPVISFGGFSEWRRSPSFAEVSAMYSPSQPAKFGPVHDAPGGIDRYLSLDRRASALALPGALKGLRSVNGYESLSNASYLRRVGNMRYNGKTKDKELIVDPRSHVLDLLRVTTIVSHGSTPRTPRLPDSFLVGEAGPAPERRVLDSLYGRRPFDPARSAVLDTPCGPPCGGLRAPGVAGTARTVRWESDSVHLDVDARRAALLNVSQAWFPGWRGAVDGHPAPVVRSDGLITAVPVAAGRHRVELRYEPPGLRVGAAISLLTALALGFAALVRARRRRGRG